MQEYNGNLTKMSASANQDSSVNYVLHLDDHSIDMNALIGHTITLTHHNAIYCHHCHKKTNKSFNQGYCYRCFTTLAQCDSCIIKPEKCHYAANTCRDPAWGEANCFSEHFVYLANTGTIKIGITRHVSDAISSRWLDQGATQAIVVMRVPDRLVSGLVETIFKQHIGDKTNWRAMLKGQPENVDLVSMRDELLQKVDAELNQLASDKGLTSFAVAKSDSVNIHYPVITYPNKITSINLDKTPTFTGKLLGIKGQYLLLDDDRVINIRKYGGYNVTLNVA